MLKNYKRAVSLAKVIGDIERMLKVLINSLEKSLNPGLFKSIFFNRTANLITTPYPILVI
jgi:hypothetical protein